VKRALEDAQLALTSNLNARLRLEAEHNARRLDEVRALSQLKREGEVEFEGQVDSATAEELIIAGVRIRGSNSVAAGDRVRVRVRATTGGEVVLETLSPIVVAPPIDRPLPTFTVTREATSTRRVPTATTSPEPTRTPRREPTATLTVAPPTETPTREPTRAPTEARATLTPAPRPTEPPPTTTPGRGRP
jgi:hypothetical protein